MKKVLVIAAICILLGVNYKSNEEAKVIIPDRSLRLRIIANSDNPSDIKIKMNLKKVLETKLSELLNKSDSLENTKDVISNNLDYIDELIAKELNNVKLSYKINYGNNYFPTKTHKGVIYNEGEYDSLVITLGEGKGDNWWCVLFPPLCLLENNDEVEDVEYQFYVARIINYFK